MVKRGRSIPWGRLLLSAGLLLSLAACGAPATRRLAAGNGKQWYKGNTHTHTLWSDGDAAPEVSIAWYKDRGYHFLCLSDHNILSDGSVEKWKRIEDTGPVTPERVKALRDEFGADWVDLRETGGQREMRLKTLPELRDRFEEAGDFLLIQGEEITSSNPDVHVNGLNIRDLILPIKSRHAGDVLAAAVAAVIEQEKRYGIPTLPHLNHPNFAGTVTAEDIIPVTGERFFEVFNGHPGVRNWGDDQKRIPSTDRIWDIILAMRLADPDGEPIYGIATDDTHHYFESRVGKSNSGRGWIMVLAEELTTEAILAAMKRGDLYASTGVMLTAIADDAREMRVSIEAEPGVAYTTRFIGTPKDFDTTSRAARDEHGAEIRATRIYSEKIGRVLMETRENPAVYEFNGNELYVRAKIISSKAQHNPHAEGDLEVAWTQPVVRK